MSYKCYNCGKKFDEDIESCDRCGAKKVKFSSNKLESNNDEITYHSVSLLPLFIIINVGFLILAVVTLPNMEYSVPFIGVALASIGIARLVYPTSRTVYYMFSGEMFFFFWMIIGLVYIIVGFIKLLIGKR